MGGGSALEPRGMSSVRLQTWPMLMYSDCGLELQPRPTVRTDPYGRRPREPRSSNLNWQKADNNERQSIG